MPKLQPLLELYIPVPHRHIRKLLLDPSGTRPRHSNAIGTKLRFRKHHTFLLLILVVTEPDDVPNVLPVGSCAQPDQVFEKRRWALSFQFLSSWFGRSGCEGELVPTA